MSGMSGMSGAWNAAAGCLQERHVCFVVREKHPAAVVVVLLLRPFPSLCVIDRCAGPLLDQLSVSRAPGLVAQRLHVQNLQFFCIPALSCCILARSEERRVGKEC